MVLITIFIMLAYALLLVYHLYYMFVLVESLG